MHRFSPAVRRRLTDLRFISGHPCNDAALAIDNGSEPVPWYVLVIQQTKEGLHLHGYGKGPEGPSVSKDWNLYIDHPVLGGCASLDIGDDYRACFESLPLRGEA